MNAGNNPPVRSWADRQTKLLAFAKKQIFFVGGAPRSGTTWMRRLLDAHPDVSCRGEALFFQNLATPIDALVKQRVEAIAGKKERIFKQNGGNPLPDGTHADQMIATGILVALQQQCADRPPVEAVGEKTPENVFFFPRLLRFFLARGVEGRSWPLARARPASARPVSEHTACASTLRSEKARNRFPCATR